MLPKTEYEMFKSHPSGSLVDQMIFIIVPFDGHVFNEESKLIGRYGNEWAVIGVFLVTEDAFFNGVDDPLIEDDPEGIFIEELSLEDRDYWPSLRDLFYTARKGGKGIESLGEWMAGYSYGRKDFAFIFPAELYNIKFAKATINYQQIP